MHAVMSESDIGGEGGLRTTPCKADLAPHSKPFFPPRVRRSADDDDDPISLSLSFSRRKNSTSSAPTKKANWVTLSHKTGRKARQKK